MDQFNLLSLEDNNDKGLDSDIWNLSLNDGNRPSENRPTENNNNNVIVPHTPNTQSFNYIDNNTVQAIDNNNKALSIALSNDVDIDMLDIESTQEEQSQSDHEILSQTEIDQEEEKNTITLSPMANKDSLSDSESIHSINDNSIDKSIIVSKLLLSPTQLGASLVTNTSNNNLNIEQVNHNHSIIRHNNKDIWKQLLTDKQLINVNINNHNYFNNNNNNSNDIYSEDDNSNLIMERDDPNLLPLPWSSVSTPHFKKWYDSISYIQWFLNVFSICFIIYLLISSMSKDMKSIWYQNKMVLINESQNCQLQYNLNHCDINFNLPEMSQVCQDWWVCSHRDNNKLINNRTNLLIKFLTSLINEFINELNWKTLFVSIILILGWFFISNFTMGFIRAKTYYGSGKIKDQ